FVGEACFARVGVRKGQSRPRSSSRTRQRGCGRVVRLFENLVSKRVLFPCLLSAAWRSRLGQNQAQASCRAREIDKIQVRAGKPSADAPGGSCDGLCSLRRTV